MYSPSILMAHSPTTYSTTTESAPYGAAEPLSMEEKELVDSAKNILMQQRNLNADEAYSLLSEMADKRKTGLADMSVQLLKITHRLTV